MSIFSKIKHKLGYLALRVISWSVKDHPVIQYTESEFFWKYNQGYGLAQRHKERLGFVSQLVAVRLLYRENHQLLFWTSGETDDLVTMSNKLVKQEPISPLSGEYNEWVNNSVIPDKRTKINKRYSSVIMIDHDKCFDLSKNSTVPISFPYDVDTGSKRHSDTAITAMCLWEAVMVKNYGVVINNYNDDKRPWSRYLVKYGMAELREFIFSIAKHCDKDWDYTAKLKEDNLVEHFDVFDWGFCPWWVVNCVDWNAEKVDLIDVFSHSVRHKIISDVMNDRT